jgi:hypothetical protein
MPTTITLTSDDTTIDLRSNDAALDKSNSELIVVAAFCAVGLALTVGFAWLSSVPDDFFAIISSLG